MTNEEALTHAKHELEAYKAKDSEYYNNKKYTEFYEAVVEALEKQMPKHPVENSERYSPDVVFDCPCCGEYSGLFHNDNQEYSYCTICGQKLKWKPIITQPYITMYHGEDEKKNED